MLWKVEEMRHALRLFLAITLVSQLGVQVCPAQAPGKKQPANVSEALSPLCNPKLPVHPFSLDSSGNVSNTGRSFEGPACIQVYYNPFQYEITLSQKTVQTSGPDLSQVALGGGKLAGATPSATPTPTPTPASVSEAFGAIKRERDALRGQLDQTKGLYTPALKQEEGAIAAIKKAAQNTSRLNPGQLPAGLRNAYRDLQKPLRDALGQENKFVPTDLPNNLGTVLTLELSRAADKLASLPLDFPDGITVDSANPPKCLGDPRRFAFRDWNAVCKDQYEGLKKLLDTDLQEALIYALHSDKVTALSNKLAIVKYWNLRFQNVGFRVDMDDNQIDGVPVEPSIMTAVSIPCGMLFNQSSSTAVSVLSVDEMPTLDGSNPTVKMQDAFVGVTCQTPFSVSAGIGFNTIRQQEFAIIKSVGGPNNTSVNKFGTVNSSQISPMPIAMAHARLWDWGNHKYAFHASFGVAANIQGQASGGSSAAFLPGASFSFWRTMYLSFGPLIGTKSELAGGFKVGDTVPSDITTISGQVQRSYTVGFGFAVTFTKP